MNSFFLLQSKISDEHQRKSTPVIYYSIHALIAAYFNLVSKLYGITGFSQHVDEVNPAKNFAKNFLFYLFR